MSPRCGSKKAKEIDDNARFILFIATFTIERLVIINHCSIQAVMCLTDGCWR
jgi:hypothetical protein